MSRLQLVDGELTLDQRHYFTYCARQQAQGRVLHLTAYRDQLAATRNPAVALAAADAETELAEWRRIERACSREIARLAALKHFST